MKSNYIAVCKKQSLPKSRAFVTQELRELKVQEQTSHQLVLAVDEACANSIIHQHSCDGISNIRVSVGRVGNEVRIEITDRGVPFPIHEYQPLYLQDIIE